MNNGVSMSLTGSVARVQSDTVDAGLVDDNRPLRDGGIGPSAYAEAVAVYLALAVDKVADRNSTVCAWASLREHARNTFGRQAIPMVWDFAESNPLSDSSGNFLGGIVSISSGLGSIRAPKKGYAFQRDAKSTMTLSESVVSTDPPYYDNIGYADLSDFFYVWLRRSLKPVFPEIFATLAVPKAEELVATPYRHGSKAAAETFFLDGMTKAMHRLARRSHPGFPVSIYYAFKQSERKGSSGVTSTGWEAFLDAAIRSDFAISGTWPMRTELGRRMISMGTNALASSIVLVCRRRPDGAPLATRREFLTALRAELPRALRLLQSGNIAPVDLAQAAIGPGMAVYTRYASAFAVVFVLPSRTDCARRAAVSCIAINAKWNHPRSPAVPTTHQRRRRTIQRRIPVRRVMVPINGRSPPRRHRRTHRRLRAPPGAFFSLPHDGTSALTSISAKS